jgi:glutamine amidotransferase
MTSPEVIVVSTGTANVASVMAGLRRAGAQPILSDDAELVRGARGVVLPGVGTFAAGMDHLTRSGVAAAIHERAAAGLPLLAICLGMQMLAATSDESPGTAGIGVLASAVVRIPSAARVPQLGWIEVTPEGGADLIQTGYAYFANSYRVATLDAGWRPAYATNGERFIAGLERERQLACQFHPELSGAWGTALLARWVDAC